MPAQRGQSSQGQGFLLHLGRAVRARRMGDAGLAEARLAGRALLDSIAELRQESPTVVVDLAPDRLYCRGDVLHATAAPELAIPLSDQGLRSIRLEADADRAAIAGFVDVLASSEGGDAAVRLWKADLPGIGWDSDVTDLFEVGPAAEGIAASLRPPGRLRARPTPPAEDPALHRLRAEVLADQGPAMLRTATPLILGELERPERVEAVGVAAAAGLVRATLARLERAGEGELLGKATRWMARVLKGPGDSHPLYAELRRLAADGLQRRRARPRLADALALALGPLAGELLKERLAAAEGDEARGLMWALAAVDGAAVRAHGEAHPDLRPQAEAALQFAGPQEQALAWAEQVLRWRPMLRRSAHRQLQLAVVAALGDERGLAAGDALTRHRTHSDPAVREAVELRLGQR